MGKISILVAEDHKLVRETCTFLLNSDSRFEVVAACDNTTEAVILAQKYLPEIALMDINILPLNGFWATAEILQVSPVTKVIGLSSYADLIYVQKMFAAGAKGYLTKTSGYQELFEAIMRVREGKTYVCREIRDKGYRVSPASEMVAPVLGLLSNREKQISHFIKEGLHSDEIGNKLKISSGTVEFHLANIISKLNLDNIVSLASFMHSKLGGIDYNI